MNLFIGLVGFALLVFVIGVCWYKAIKNEEEYDKKNRKKVYTNGLFFLTLVSIVLIVFSFSFTIIPTGYTGVRSTFGQIDPVSMQNGFNMKLPFVQKIELVNNKLQDVKIDGQIWSETSARTALFYEAVTISYQINTDKSAWIYANISNYKEAIISAGIVSSAVKQSSVILADIDATNRGKIEPLVLDSLQKSLDIKYGTNIVRIARVVIGNVDFEESYTKAVSAKQAAQLAYEQQQIINKQAVEKAETDAKVKYTQAEAEAKAKLVAAQAEAESNKKIADSLSADIFQQRFYERWDGKLPVVIGSDDNILDVAGLIK